MILTKLSKLIDGVKDATDKAEKKTKDILGDVKGKASDLTGNVSFFATNESDVFDKIVKIFRWRQGCNGQSREEIERHLG